MLRISDRGNKSPVNNNVPSIELCGTPKRKVRCEEVTLLVQTHCPVFQI